MGKLLNKKLKNLLDKYLAINWKTQLAFVERGAKVLKMISLD